MNPLIPAAHAQNAPPPAGGDMMQFVFLIGLFLIFYFLLIRPQRKRQKEHTEMVGNLAKGDEVLTSAGILGRISKLDDSYLILKVSDNVELKFQRASVQAVLPKGTLKSVGDAGD
jgi:preprotein translocase subunit YajC